MTVPVGPIEKARGASLLPGFYVDSGDPATVTSFTAKLKRLVNGQVDPTDAGVVLTPTFVAASGGTPAMFVFTLASSSALTPGSYIADARFVVGGGVVISRGIKYTIVEAASSS